MQKINYIIIARRAKRQSNNGVPIVRRRRLDSMRYMLQLILIADSFRVLLHLKSAINAIKTKLQTETACSDGLVLFCYNLNRSSWSLWMLTMVTWRILFFFYRQCPTTAYLSLYRVTKFSCLLFNFCFLLCFFGR